MESNRPAFARTKMTMESLRNVNRTKICVFSPKRVLFIKSFSKDILNSQIIEVDGGGSTYYRNCFVGGQTYCQSYDYHGVNCLLFQIFSRETVESGESSQLKYSAWSKI